MMIKNVVDETERLMFDSIDELVSKNKSAAKPNIIIVAIYSESVASSRYFVSRYIRSRKTISRPCGRIAASSI